MLITNIIDTSLSNTAPFYIVTQAINQKKRFTMKKFQNVEGIALKILKCKEPSVNKEHDNKTSHVSEDSKH